MLITAPLGNPALHFSLTQIAARHCGVDLAAALGEGRLNAKGHADMITRCRGCQMAAECEAQLALGRVPGHCPNAELFKVLAG